MSSTLLPLSAIPSAAAAPARKEGAGERRHDIDALRALAFALVILYHLGMVYVADWPWHLKSPHAAQWLQWPMRLLNLWRMDLVFLVSGVSLALLALPAPGARRASSPMALLRSRVWRLLLPLAFGMLVVVPYQAYAQGVANGAVAPGFGAFLWRYLAPGAERWPAAAFDGADFGITWNHLWFLPYLLLYTAVVLLGLGLRRAWPAHWARGSRWDRGGPMRCGLVGWLLLPWLVLLAAALWLAPRFAPTHDLLHDGYLHVRYGTVFLAGWVLGRREAWWRALAVGRHAALLLALVAATVLVAGAHGAWGVAWASPAPAVVRTVYSWSMLLAILGYAHHALNRPWRWLGWARESVYPWYMLHQTLLILVVVWVVPWGLGPVAEPLVLLAATLAGCWCLTDGLVRRVGWLRACFGLPPRRR